MSLNGALISAVTGLGAQSNAMGAISENIANSQTIGYKDVGTDFSTLINVSGSQIGGGVTSTPVVDAAHAGTVQNSSVSTNLAISNQGFFAVSQVTGFNGTTPTFAAQNVFTRAGDFALNKSGYMVNGSGNYLNGYPYANGTPTIGNLQPIQINNQSSPPQQTTAITYAANLPAQAVPAGSPLTVVPGTAPGPGVGQALAPTQVSFIDAQGVSHLVNVQWTANSNNDFTGTFTSSDPAVSLDAGVSFGSAPTNTVSADFQFSSATGALVAITPNGAANNSPVQMNGAATMPLGITLGTLGGAANVAQPITMNFGTYGAPGTLTNNAGTAVSFVSAQGDGLAPGNFTGVTVNSQGLVTASYDNGSHKTLYQVPLAVFTNPNGLNPQNGNVFAATQDSGNANVELAGSNGAGTLVGSATEASTVDIAQEFTKLIQTQNAYSANSKVITTANQMFQVTNQMVQ